MADDREKLRSWLAEAGVICSKPPILSGVVKFEKPIRTINDVELVDCSIGAYSYFSADTRVARTNIGRYASIGGGVRIGLSKHPKNRLTTSPITYKNIFDGRILTSAQSFAEYEQVKIGHDVWVGERSIIMDGVTIGTGAIIAAGSVVTRDVAPYAIVAGVPAKLLRHRFPQTTVERILQSAWWQYDLVNISSYGGISDWSDPIRCVEEITTAASLGRILPMKSGTMAITRNLEQYTLEKSENSIF